MLYHLSKTDKPLLKQCTYRCRQTQLTRGFFVLITGLFWGSGTLFILADVYPNAWLLILPIAIILGLVVMYMDREIVAANDKRLTTALMRLAFCVMVGYMVSLPFKFELFQYRIEQEVTRLREEKNIAIGQELEARKSDFFSSIDPRIESADQTYEKYITRAAQYKALEHKELYGKTCDECSGYVGAGPASRAAAKKAAYYDSLATASLAEIDGLKTRRSEFEADTEAEYAARTADKGWNDVAIKYEALHIAADESSAVKVLIWLYTLLFVLIETAPLLAKWATPDTEYDTLLKSRQRVKQAWLQRIETESIHQANPMDYWEEVLGHFHL